MKIKPLNSLTHEEYICVVIPAYKVKSQVLEVISSIGPEVKKIIVVDDSCPEKSGEHVESKNNDPRVEVIFHAHNLGVGGAMKTGYKRALELNSDIIVKIDGDGQMDPSLIPIFVNPLKGLRADYTKGNRFFDVEHIREMPKVRILGNLVLSFFAKFSTGYWRIFDPNNGFTAINGHALQRIDLDKLDNRYFFESDLLFRLNLVRAVVLDIPMEAKYGAEESSLRIKRVLVEFPIKHTRNFLKRVTYTYYLRDFTLASIELPIGLGLTSFGFVTGLTNFLHSQSLGQATPTGTLILVSMSILVGIQLILGFFAYDIDSSPTSPIEKFI